ncbi:hypothetical protein CVIRNUC_008793 [Coccomyxa viridis]|uniref:Uncharacterized protein n=1 Tax=Coccomyxa viridis TaxID=1274662 RepID=A0AAV1IE44_9CHLO|nr:hypothetical protein CVIRNUC_008793 [Coccomyxa viridis]
MHASAALVFACACAALSLLSPVRSLEYYTGQTSRRRLQQGPGGGTCQNGPRSAQYRCMAVSSRSSGYQFCTRLCQSGLGGRNSDDSDNESPPPSRDLVGSAANGGNNTRLQTAGGLGGSTLGSAGVGGAGSCTPCLDVQQQCQRGESGGGGLSQAYYRAYVNRYYSGVNCQDIGPAVAIGASNASPSPSYSPSPAYSPPGSGGR